MVEHEGSLSVQLKDHALYVFRKAINDLKVKNISPPSGYRTANGEWRTFYDDLDDLLESGKVVEVAKEMIRTRLGGSVAIDVN